MSADEPPEKRPSPNSLLRRLDAGDWRQSYELAKRMEAERARRIRTEIEKGEAARGVSAEPEPGPESDPSSRS